MKVAFYIKEDIFEDGCIDMQACLVIDNSIIISDWSAGQDGLNLNVDGPKYARPLMSGLFKNVNMTFISWL